MWGCAGQGPWLKEQPADGVSAIVAILGVLSCGSQRRCQRFLPGRLPDDVFRFRVLPIFPAKGQILVLRHLETQWDPLSGV